MRYKLRSSTKSNSGSSRSSDEREPEMPSSDEGSRRPKVRRKTLHKHETVPADEPEEPQFDTTIMALPQEVILMIGEYLDARSLLDIFRSCNWFYNMLIECDAFWKMICVKEEMANYSCLEDDRPTHLPEKIGWADQPMHYRPPPEFPYWRKVFLRGLQMRRNIWKSNYEGWRIYANSDLPVEKLSPNLDLNEVKKRMGDFPKLSVNDDLKIDWDDKYLVVFHFFRGEGESCKIRLWNIEDEPKFLYGVDKGIECITDKVSVTNNHVVIVPSWPLEAGAIVMTLDIQNEMREVGHYLFANQARRNAIDEHWEHTQLRVVRDKAMVVCRCPEWYVIVVDLPSCQPLSEIKLTDVSVSFDCEQIRSYKSTAMLLFAKKQNDSSNSLVTIDINGKNAKLRSSYPCTDVSDVALFTEPEEIYLMKRNGDVVLFDANLKTETVKIANQHRNVNSNLNEYQLFVNRKEQICVMQSAAEVSQGRYIKVYSYSEKHLYSINLDLCRYGMSRDESICIYTNGAFLAAADSKKFALFNVKTGQYLGSIHIPNHLERSKGKDEKDCMFGQTGLSLFIFDEDKLIAVHDYERSFPAVLDIYKFW